MKPADALTTVREIMSGPRAEEHRRLDYIQCALSPRRDSAPSVELPKNPNPVMLALARKSRTNMLPLILDQYSQGMKVVGVSSADGGTSPAMKYWDANQLEARQAGINRSTLAFGAAYGLALPGDRGPSLRGRSARTMTAVYQNPYDDEYPMFALDVDGPMIRLYDEEAVYFVGVESRPRSGLGVPTSAPAPWSLEFIESRSHDMGVCPVVRFRDRMLLEGEELFGIIEPLLTIQERIDETVFGLLVAQFYAAFKQRYAIGWVPKSEQESLEASAAAFWAFEDPDVKVGELSETDLTRYLTSKDNAFGDMAAVAQVSAQTLGKQGISNVSAETISALEHGKAQKSDEIMTSLGESYSQWLRLAALIDGDSSSAADMSVKIRWKNTQARSLGATVDALVKMVTSLGVPEELARQQIPDWSDALEAEARKIGPTPQVGSADPLSEFLSAMDRQSQPVPGSGVVAG
jgi:hypothetical protein